MKAKELKQALDELVVEGMPGKTPAEREYNRLRLVILGSIALSLDGLEYCYRSMLDIQKTKAAR